MQINKNKKQEFAKLVNDNLPELGNSSIVFVSQKKGVKLPPNVMVFQAFAYLAATKLKDSSNRVLMLLFSQSAYENYISMDVKTISEILNYTERSVITALSELVKNNIILKIKHPSDNRRHDYFLNPTSAWKGNSTSRLKMITKMDSNQLDIFGQTLENKTKKIVSDKSFE